MSLEFQVSTNKIKRVIIDSDAACEADDPFAIAHALMSPKFDVLGIAAEQFGRPGSVQKSYEEIQVILQCMQLSVPVYLGEETELSATDRDNISPAAQFIIEEALREDSRPLHILCLGALTNVASAIQKYPDIVHKLTVIWIGGQNPEQCDPDFHEFNCGNDIEAANLVMASGASIWQIPSDVYGSMHIGLAEIQRRIAPCGKIGQHLFHNMVRYNESEEAAWTEGESWSIGDSPAIGVLLAPGCGRYTCRKAPVFDKNTCSHDQPGQPQIRVYHSVDSRFIIEDLIAKLELLYG